MLPRISSYRMRGRERESERERKEKRKKLIECPAILAHVFFPVVFLLCYCFNPAALPSSFHILIWNLKKIKKYILYFPAPKLPSSFPFHSTPAKTINPPPPSPNEIHAVLSFSSHPPSLLPSFLAPPLPPGCMD